MISYEIGRIIHLAIPYLGGAVCVLIGVWIANMFLKPRIHRYAKAEIIQTLEFQENKIKNLEEKLRLEKSINSDLRGFKARALKGALNIIGEGKV